MIKECSGARLHLTALPSKSGDSPKTRVEIERDGERQELAPPAEMVDYTAVGLGCAEDGKGTNYFVIQYGELPYGCEFCEWFFLYDAKGQLLNHAAPPLREQDGQQSPNNDEYEHKLEELGLKHPESTLTTSAVASCSRIYASAAASAVGGACAMAADS
ncbi:hypothetical protein QTJ10_23505 [Xanthomonas hortorum pv. vitians]|uniref:hypothetical protein n=1 Tax=Xanthomonas hortorum TaxID=56454 RepID=UPI0025A20E3B|nr:hypothetical protein [Xanthomonas hortorum]WJM76561.1 hypothetical protein QTJ10_23505 [Xanthomonas hortorum pv. vitians]